MRRTIVAQTHQEILHLRYLWKRVERHRPATMFQSFAWNYLVARAFENRERPHVIYVETDNGTALIPAVVAHNRAELTLMGETLFDYRDVLSSGDQQALHAAWNQASRLNLKFSAGAIRQDANFAPRMEFRMNRYYGAPKVSLSEIRADEFAAKHGRLARFHRRMQREGIEFRCRTGNETGLMQFIYRQKGNQATETGPNLFGDGRRIQFMVEIARIMGNACEIFTYESAGTLVAALVTFRDHDVRRFYTVYFDPRWARYSPGMALINEVTKRSLTAGLDCDYMTGEHDYKLRFATSVVPMYWAEASANALAWIGSRRSALAA